MFKNLTELDISGNHLNEEIADILGINEGTSKSQLARAKGVLKKMVDSRLNITSNVKEI